MPTSNTKCAHCGAPIVDPSTIVEENGLVYCCRNCEAAGRDETPVKIPLR
jgi:hypothetical protein